MKKSTRPLSKRSLPYLLQRRETKEVPSWQFQDSFQVTEPLIHRLGQVAELDGHSGCVNCIQWNQTGDTLASGSDDVKILLWNPFVQKKRHTINTSHHGNIFSVKFMPYTNDNILASGAADSRIHIHDVIKEETVQVYSNHTNRVKRIDVAQDTPNLLWSASEDGTVMQFDLRCSDSSSTILVNLLSAMGRTAEAKCLSINPIKPELLAVGANDPFVRIYDRRMIRPQVVEFPSEMNGRMRSYERRNYLVKAEEMEQNISTNCVQYFVPGHLPGKEHDYKRRFRPLASTYVTFSPNGKELLVNLGGEQIYLFDVFNPRRATQFELPILPDVCDSGHKSGTNGFSHLRNGKSLAYSAANGKSSQKMSPEVEEIKLEANAEFENKHYTGAISLYSRALALVNHPILLGNRAAAFMKRQWDGDVYAALRDCRNALAIDPNHTKAHLRLARCLFELKRLSEATECLSQFKRKYPEHVNSLACKSLDKDLKESGEKAAAEAKDKPTKHRENDEDEEEVTVSDFLLSEYNNSDSNESSDSGPSNRAQRTRQKPLSALEQECRDNAFDYERRFCGHCNTTTDIKEANFFGSGGQYILAGSDDGKFFIWDRETTNIVRILRGDDSIVNCLQSHPSTSLLATSGIDPVVRLWAPLPEDGRENERVVDNLDDAALANQRRMNADPFETILLNMGYRMAAASGGDEEPESPGQGAVHCRTS